VLKITSGDILLAFGGLVLGLGLAHTLIFSISKLVCRTQVEKIRYIFWAYQVNLLVMLAHT
jgi:hypothetical protein